MVQQHAHVYALEHVQLQVQSDIFCAEQYLSVTGVKSSESSMVDYLKLATA
jgi:hypothetical protein